MYTFDLFRDDRFLVCLGRYSVMHHADAAAFNSFSVHASKPENAGVRWQVRQWLYDGEGELDQTILVREYVATA